MYSFNILYLFIRLVQMKPIQKLFWPREYRPLEIVHVGAEAGIPLMGPLHKELCGLLLEL
jgi:hypothetical protein